MLLSLLMLTGHRLLCHHHGAYLYENERMADAPIDLVNISAADQLWGCWPLLPSDPCAGGDGSSLDRAPGVGFSLHLNEGSSVPSTTLLVDAVLTN